MIVALKTTGAYICIDNSLPLYIEKLSSFLFCLVYKRKYKYKVKRELKWIVMNSIKQLVEKEGRKGMFHLAVIWHQTYCKGPLR